MNIESGTFGALYLEILNVVWNCNVKISQKLNFEYSNSAIIEKFFHSKSTVLYEDPKYSGFLIYQIFYEVGFFILIENNTNNKFKCKFLFQQNHFEIEKETLQNGNILEFEINEKTKKHFKIKTPLANFSFEKRLEIVY